jgi:hypothetical protein
MRCMDSLEARDQRNGDANRLIDHALSLHSEVISTLETVWQRRRNGNTLTGPPDP